MDDAEGEAEAEEVKEVFLEELRMSRATVLSREEGEVEIRNMETAGRSDTMPKYFVREDVVKAIAHTFALVVWMAFISTASQALCLWNCSPTDLSGRAAFEHYLRDSSGGTPYQIENFRKTNGQDIEMMGRKAYLMDVEAVVLFPEGMNAVCLNKDYGAANYYQKMQTSLKCMEIRNGSGLIVAPGGRATIARQLGFEKTEQGWRGQDGRLYK